MGNTRRMGAALIAGAVALTGFAAVPVIAQEGMPGMTGPQGAFSFETLDANKDGKITRDEIAAARKARTEGLDADKDGFLTAAEIAAFRLKNEKARIEADAARMVERMDLNADGKIGADEMMAGHGAGLGSDPERFGRMFDRLDTDKDGAISKAEADAAHAKMRDRMMERRGPDGKRGPHGDRGGKGHWHDRGGDQGDRPGPRGDAPMPPRPVN